MMRFDLPKELSSLIKVVGVGGGGSNAVNHMFRQGITGVDFLVCNTDKQALEISPVPVKIQLGASLTQGLGAGSIPEVGKNSAIESLDQVKDLLGKSTKMVFITAGMGGGTGTGAAPIIAQATREMGILTVAIVTIPFSFEGKKKRAQAEEGIEQLKKQVDCLLVISNDKLREIYGNLGVKDSFAQADNVLTGAAKSIAELISITKHMNVDFNDVHTAMKDSGVALMGTGSASGENRAIKAVEIAMASPLLNDNEITGARYVLLDITSGKDELTMDELGEITDFIQDATGISAEIKIGYGIDENLGDNVNVTIIATGFNAKPIIGYEISKKSEKKVLKLEDESLVSGSVENKDVTADKVQTSDSQQTSELTLSERDKELEPTLKVVESPVEEVVIPESAVEESVVENVQTSDSGLQITGEEPVIMEAVEETAVVMETPVIEEPVIMETPTFEDVSSNEETFIDEETVSLVEEPVAEAQDTVTEEIPTLEDQLESEESPVVEEFYMETSGEVVNEVPKVEADAFETDASSEVKEIEIQFSVSRLPGEILEDSVQATGETTQTTVSETPVVDEELNFTVRTEEPKKEEPVADNSPLQRTVAITEKTVVAKAEEEDDEETITNNEQVRKAQERIMRLKELSYKLKTPSGLAELENEPAYKRKGVNLENTPHSTESNVSRYTLSEGDDKKAEIKPNNSFLHDNVD